LVGESGRKLREINAAHAESKVITVRGAFFAEVGFHQYVAVDVDRPGAQARQTAQEQAGGKEAARLSRIEHYHIEEGA
jgi:hypothetical protein